MKKVSVIIPIYNTKEYLAECLDSIINQTLTDIEIICINDGSTDGSEKIAITYQKTYENITLITQENAGQSAARNAGMKVASGKYVYFMDSDDLLIATALEELWTMAEAMQLDVLYFSAVDFYESTELQKNRTDFKNRYLRKGQYNEVVKGSELLVSLCKNDDYIVSTCLQFIRRNYLIQHGISFWEGIIHEDNLFGFTVLMNANRAFCVKEIYFYRRVRIESVMTKKENYRNLYGYYTCLIQQLRVAADCECNEEERNAIVGVFRGLLYHVKRLFYTIGEDERAKFLDACDSYGRYVMESIIIGDIFEMNRLKWERDRDVQGLQDELNSLRYQFNCMQNSISFRVGRALTCFPRKIKTSIRIFRGQGIAGIIRVIIDKIGH